MKVPNMSGGKQAIDISLSRLQNEGSQLGGVDFYPGVKSIKATE